jgi:hypothetical protein
VPFSGPDATFNAFVEGFDGRVKGKRSTEAILTWPAAPGATGYAIEVNFTPQAPNGTWVALTSGTGRRRIVKAPTPQAQFLARVASLGSGGTQADWSDPVMCTAL